MSKNYKKLPYNSDTIEVNGKVIFSFDERYQEYVQWKNDNPDLEKKLVEELNTELRIQELYNNGAPHMEYDDRQILKRKKFYYENGNLKWDGEFKDDRVDGKVIQYNESGQLISIESFKKGIMEGEFEYYENGLLNQSGCILSNKKHGEFRKYWINGNLKQIENYKQGVNHGKFKSYRIDNTLRYEGQYLNNYKNGDWSWYHINGNLRRQEIYEDRMLIRESEFDEDGQKLIVISREDFGQMNHGHQKTHKQWYKNGNPKKLMTYKYERLDGDFKEWYVNGNKRCDGVMKFNVMDGDWCFYYHNGKVEMECTFHLGQIKKYKIYHDNGSVKK